MDGDAPNGGAAPPAYDRQPAAVADRRQDLGIEESAIGQPVHPFGHDPADALRHIVAPPDDDVGSEFGARGPRPPPMRPRSPGAHRPWPAAPRSPHRRRPHQSPRWSDPAPGPVDPGTCGRSGRSWAGSRQPRTSFPTGCGRPSRRSPRWKRHRHRRPGRPARHAAITSSPTVQSAAFPDLVDHPGRVHPRHVRRRRLEVVPRCPGFETRYRSD